MGGGGDDVHANATLVFCTDDDASDVADAAIAFMTKLTIVLAADDHEHDSVAPCWPCCKLTFATPRACRFLLLHFGNAQKPRVLKLSRQKLRN